MLKGWNMLLVILAFSLSILGTFLIRSGVISSVHAFGDGPVGPAFLAFFGFITLVSFGLVAWRWDQVRDTGELDAAVSREGSILAANVLFLALTFTVLLGTLFPLLVEAISGQRVTVGAPFFDQITVPIWFTVFLLMGIGPLLPWRKSTNQSFWRNLLWLLSGALVASGIAWAFGMRRPYPLITLALAGYNLVSLGLLLVGAVAPRARLSGKSVLKVFRQYAFESRRRFGSMITHFGVIIIAVGIMASSAYRIDEQMTVNYGQSSEFHGYELRPVEQFMEQSPARISAGAIVEVWRGERHVTTLRPRINVFGSNPQRVATPDVHYTATHDLYLSLVGVFQAGQSTVALRVVKSPFVTWIWIGGLIVLFGTGFAVSPQARYARVRAEATAEQVPA